jgi:hypothetical protein
MFRFLSISGIFLTCLTCVGAVGEDARVQLNLNISEAEAVVAILNKRAANREPSEDDWNRLFSSPPYQALKRREEAFHNPLSDENFKQFVLSSTLAEQGEVLEKSLVEWSQLDLRAAAQRVLSYLPPSSVVKAEVYLVIKPHKNSFVFQGQTGPIIFLNLEPTESMAHVENKVAHELHHIGLDSSGKSYEQQIAGLPEGPRKASAWMSSFGEGLAMLAAAGSANVHPHATSRPEDRERWDRDMLHFGSDLRAVDRFLLDVADGRLKGNSIDDRGDSFYGTQGPWYTVGYKMAVLIENNFGREELIRCMQDPRRLLAMYNKAASKNKGAGKEQMELWSPELLKAVQAPQS